MLELEMLSIRQSHQKTLWPISISHDHGLESDILKPLIELQTQLKVTATTGKKKIIY